MAKRSAPTYSVAQIATMLNIPRRQVYYALDKLNINRPSSTYTLTSSEFEKIQATVSLIKKREKKTIKYQDVVSEVINNRQTQAEYEHNIRYLTGSLFVFSVLVAIIIILSFIVR